MWWVTTKKNGASALGLQRNLGLKSYETVWAWLHKFRRAMVRPGRDLLSGRVELDECYIGAPEEGMQGRGTADNALVVSAVEEKGSEMGRIQFLLVILNSATRYSPILPANIVHCCHPVHKHSAMGGPREKAASSTPEACWSVYR
jgi:hypothetical protein